MKKYINGKVYDTETAKLVCRDHWIQGGNFRRVVNMLFRKKTGEFFLLSNEVKPGGQIIPLITEEADQFKAEFVRRESMRKGHAVRI